MKEKMERDRDERKDDFLRKNVSEPSNPSDESAQNVPKKNSLPDELFLCFYFESSESYRVFNDLHDSDSILRAAGINSERFFGRTVRPGRGQLVFNRLRSLVWF